MPNASFVWCFPTYGHIFSDWKKSSWFLYNSSTRGRECSPPCLKMRSKLNLWKYVLYLTCVLVWIYSNTTNKQKQPDRWGSESMRQWQAHCVWRCYSCASNLSPTTKDVATEARKYALYGSDFPRRRPVRTGQLPLLSDWIRAPLQSTRDKGS